MNEKFKKYTDQETFSKIVSFPNITAMWEDRVATYGDRIAIVDGEEYSYSRLNADVSAFRTVLKENGAISTTTDVLAVAVPNIPGGLNTLLQVLANANVDVSYMYSIFGHADENAYMILQLNDADEVAELLAKNGITVATKEKLGIN